MKYFIVTLSVIIFQFSFSQNRTRGILFNTNYHPTDFFSGLNYSTSKTKIEYTFGLNFGLNRTFFQARLYPKIIQSLGKNFNLGKFIQVNLNGRISESYLNVSTPDEISNIFTLEPTVGTAIYLGKKFKFGIGINYGFTFYWRNTVSTLNNWNYQRFWSPEVLFKYQISTVATKQ